MLLIIAILCALFAAIIDEKLSCYNFIDEIPAGLYFLYLFFGIVSLVCWLNYIFCL